MKATKYIGPQWLVSDICWAIYADDQALEALEKLEYLRTVSGSERALRATGKARHVAWDEFLKLNEGVRRELIAQRLEALSIVP